jgi:hypothetical protein
MIEERTGIYLQQKDRNKRRKTGITRSINLTKL